MTASDRRSRSISRSSLKKTVLTMYGLSNVVLNNRWGLLVRQDFARVGGQVGGFDHLEEGLAEVLRAGSLAEFLGGADAQDAAAGHDGDAVADLLGLPEHVRGEDDALARVGEAPH